MYYSYQYRHYRRGAEVVPNPEDSCGIARAGLFESEMNLFVAQQYEA